MNKKKKIIRNNWTKLKYWQKTASITLITTSILDLILSIWLDFGPLGRGMEVPFYLLFIWMFILYVIPATVVGGFIGFLINMYKKKYK